MSKSLTAGGTTGTLGPQGAAAGAPSGGADVGRHGVLAARAALSVFEGAAGFAAFLGSWAAGEQDSCLPSDC